MNRSIVLCATAFAVAALSAQAPAERRSIAQTLDQSFSGAESDFVPAVEAMPEALYGFRPTRGEFKKVRTFSQQAKHVAAVNYLVAAAILGEKCPVDAGNGDGPATLKTKAEVVAYVKGSYEYAHKALASIDDPKALDAIPSPFSAKTTSRLACATILISHTMDHYGQIVVYLRLNGIVPPASR